VPGAGPFDILAMACANVLLYDELLLVRFNSFIGYTSKQAMLIPAAEIASNTVSACLISFDQVFLSCDRIDIIGPFE
jgi:hypothetical protein